MGAAHSKAGRNIQQGITLARACTFLVCFDLLAIMGFAQIFNQKILQTKLNHRLDVLCICAFLCFQWHIIFYMLILFILQTLYIQNLVFYKCPEKEVIFTQNKAISLFLFQLTWFLQSTLNFQPSCTMIQI